MPKTLDGVERENGRWERRYGDSVVFRRAFFRGEGLLVASASDRLRAAGAVDEALVLLRAALIGGLVT